MNEGRQNRFQFIIFLLVFAVWQLVAIYSATYCLSLQKHGQSCICCYNTMGDNDFDEHADHACSSAESTEPNHSATSGDWCLSCVFASNPAQLPRGRTIQYNERPQLNFIDSINRIATINPAQIESFDHDPFPQGDFSNTLNKIETVILLS